MLDMNQDPIAYDKALKEALEARFKAPTSFTVTGRKSYQGGQPIILFRCQCGYRQGVNGHGEEYKRALCRNCHNVVAFDPLLEVEAP